MKFPLNFVLTNPEYNQTYLSRGKECWRLHLKPDHRQFLPLVGVKNWFSVSFVQLEKMTWIRWKCWYAWRESGIVWGLEIILLSCKLYSTIQLLYFTAAWGSKSRPMVLDKNYLVRIIYILNTPLNLRHLLLTFSTFQKEYFLLIFTSNWVWICCGHEYDLLFKQKTSNYINIILYPSNYPWTELCSCGPHCYSTWWIQLYV